MYVIGKIDMAETIGGVMHNLHIGIHYSLGKIFFWTMGQWSKATALMMNRCSYWRNSGLGYRRFKL